MPFIRRFRLPAVSCALALLFCELISHPFAEMGICDDWSYILSAHHLATTGHIAYIGWAAAMLGWQLYLGALFIKLFGFSHSTVRMATLLVAVLTAFVLQRSIVRSLPPSRHTERNATIATLALVLSPLFLELSVTYMSDIYGLFAIIVCLYACLRALQASTPNRALAWLCFAVAANAIGGSARQIAWLGVLVMVPSTLWLLRAHRRILLPGLAANVAGVLFIAACMLWLRHQPHSLPSLPVTLFSTAFPISKTIHEFGFTFLDLPFLLLPLFALFLPQLPKASRRVIAILSVVALVYAARIFHYRQFQLNSMLEPTQGDWVTTAGIYNGTFLQGASPTLLHPWAQILLTVAALGGLLGLIAAFTRPRPTSNPVSLPSAISPTQLAILLGPFTLAYLALLLPVATVALFDRYTLGLLLVLTVFLVRFYQDRVAPRLPSYSIALVAIMAIVGVSMTHNIFSLYRARIALAAELHSHGIPDTSIDAGWEANMATELQHVDSVNYSLTLLPGYTPPPPPPGPCPALWYFLSPHVHPIYAISFDPNACYGPAPFTPIHYSRWLSSSPGTLYAVSDTPTP
jgi:hypothetical protein